MPQNWTGHKLALCECGCLKKAHFSRTKNKQRHDNNDGPCSICDNCKKYKERKVKIKHQSRPSTNDYVRLIPNFRP